MLISKRNLVAGISQATGLTWLAETLPRPPALIVANYHRIGNSALTPYDPGTFSATADELFDQITLFKKSGRIISLDETIEVVKKGKRTLRSCTPILLTFDDGYRDNLEVAIPVLDSLRVPAVFFLATSFLDQAVLPWWDQIAYIIKNSRRETIILNYPHSFEVRLDDCRDNAIKEVLQIYRSPQTEDPEEFLTRLEEVCGCSRPLETQSLFLNWEDAHTLERKRIAIGSHSVSHRILSKLSPEEQVREIRESKTLLQDRLKTCIKCFAYPVGTKSAFSPFTKEALKDAGYELAFSYYGGVNRLASMDPFDVRRVSIDQQPIYRLRFQLATAKYTGQFF